MNRRIATALLPVLLATSCAGAADEPVPQPPERAIRLRFEVVETLPSGGFTARWTLVNEGTRELETAGWALYFSFHRSVDDASVEGGVAFEHLNGDFWRMVPTPEFAPLAAGESRELRFAGGGWLLKESGAPAGPYFVFESEGGEEIREPTVYELAPWPAWTGGGPNAPAAAPTAASRFAAERATSRLDLAELPPILPTPVAWERGEGSVTVDGAWTIAAPPELEREAGHLAAALGGLLAAEVAVGASAAGPGVVSLALGEVAVPGRGSGAGAEAYRLTVDPAGGIAVVGAGPAGVFYGIQSLLALLPAAAFGGGAEALEIRAIEVVDAPRFGYRGLHLDISRNFHSRATVEKLLDAMAFYKLNRFHLHLADDEGWRVAIAGLPELTEVGARRGHTLDDGAHLMPSFGSGPDPDAADNHGSGHYSRADFVALLRHAAARHIEVIPEVDVPGHARAAIKAMAVRAARLEAAGRSAEAEAFLLTHPRDTSEYRSVQGWSDNVIDVCLDSSYHFLATVFDELGAMFEEAGAPLTTIHVGGDEVPAGVWEGSPACAELIAANPGLASTDELPHYFLDRVSRMLAERGLVTAGWEEIALAEVKHGVEGGKDPNPAFVGRGFRPYIWNSVWGWGAEDLGYRLANAGYEIVLANATNLYFDLAYDRDPREFGYTWAGTVDTRKTFEFTPMDVFRSASENRLGHPIDGEKLGAGRVRPSAAGRNRILGIQGQLWGENAKGREAMEYLAFPKTLALAERAWSAQPEWALETDREVRERAREAAWNRFANVLGQRELPRLDRLFGGFAYRLPPPGAVLEEGRLRANVRYPGLEIRYSTDGSEPTARSPRWEGPVEVSGTARLRSFDGRGRGSLTTIVEP